MFSALRSPLLIQVTKREPAKCLCKPIPTMPKLRSETAVEAKLGTEPANIEYQYQFIGNYTQSCSCQHLHPGISKSVRNACFQVIVPSLGRFCSTTQAACPRAWPAFRSFHLSPQLQISCYRFRLKRTIYIYSRRNLLKPNKRTEHVPMMDWKSPLAPP